MRRGGGLELCSARAAKCPGIPGWKDPLPGPQFRGCPPLTLHPVLLALPQPDSAPSRPCFHPGRRRLPCRRCEGPAPLNQAPLVGDGKGSWELVFFQKRGKGRPPPCPSGRGWSCSGRSYFLVELLSSGECVCVALLTYDPSPHFFSPPCPISGFGG